MVSKMCCLQLDLIFIFKMAATSTVQKVEMCHISVISHHMKTNNCSTHRFSGTGNALVALFLLFKVKVTPWINVIGHYQPPASENMPYLSDLSWYKTKLWLYTYVFGYGKPLVPLFLCFKVKVTPWVKVIGHVSHQKVKICHISVPCNHIITIIGSTPRFSGMGNPLTPLVLWLKWTELKQTQQK